MWKTGEFKKCHKRPFKVLVIVVNYYSNEHLTVRLEQSIIAPINIQASL